MLTIYHTPSWSVTIESVVNNLLTLNSLLSPSASTFSGVLPVLFKPLVLAWILVLVQRGKAEQVKAWPYFRRPQHSPELGLLAAVVHQIFSDSTTLFLVDRADLVSPVQWPFESSHAAVFRTPLPLVRVYWFYINILIYRGPGQLSTKSGELSNLSGQPARVDSGLDFHFCGKMTATASPSHAS